MWTADPALGVLLEALGRRAPGLFGVTKRDRKTALLEKIADRGQPAALPHLLPFTLSRNRDESHAAAAAIDRTLRPLVPARTVALDEWLRHRVWDYPLYDSSWSKLTPQRLDRLDHLPDRFLPAVIAVASCHPNGYVREAAAKRLGQLDAHLAVPFLLVRVNDWVAAVRDAANSSLARFLTSAAAPDLVRCLALVRRLRHGTRVDHSDLVGRIETVLTSSDAQPAIEAGAEHTDVVVRRYSFELLFGAGRGDTFRISCSALDDPDPVVALSALDAGSRMLPTAALHSLLIRALRNRFARVRVSALRRVHERLPDEAPSIHQSMLLDRAASVREQAQWFVRREVGDDDLSAFYRGRLVRGETTQLAAALHGMGETGRPGDATVVSPYLADSVARVRVAAVVALRRLAASESGNAFLLAVGDPSPRVSRAAQRALIDARAHVAIDHLWATFTTASTLHVRQNVLRVIAHRQKWDAIAYLLNAHDAADEPLREAAGRHLYRWLARVNREFAPPTPEQLRAFREALARNERYLDHATHRELAFIARTTST